MRFLTFNLWHGLSPSSSGLSFVAFEALEPDARRRIRQGIQVDVLKATQADVMFLQEVNPVVKRAPLFAREMAMQAVVQPDLVGLKLFGLGIPYNLNSGLVVMASKRLGVKWVDAISLERPAGVNLARTWGSWQLKEERFALYCETVLPDWGRVLLINTHMHHGLELTEDFGRHIDQLGRELDLSDSMMSELKDRLVRANARRVDELKALLKQLDRHQDRYEAIVLAGDFNTSPESELSKMLRAAGFRDAWVEAHPGDPGYSFDGTVNVANHLLQGRFPLTLVLEDLTFSSTVKDSLLKLARAQENRPRRIDYIWFRSKSLRLRVRSAELVGRPGPDGMAPSDHFGVMADIEVE